MSVDITVESSPIMRMTELNFMRHHAVTIYRSKANMTVWKGTIAPYNENHNFTLIN